MKNKKGVSTIVASLILIVLVFAAVGIVWVVVDNIMWSPFKIYEEVCEEYDINCKNLGEKIYCKLLNETKQICELVEVEDNVIEWCYSEDDCGKIEIGKEPWKIDWLKKNCDGLQCATGNTEDCIKYKCKKHIVEVLYG